MKSESFCIDLKIDVHRHILFLNVAQGTIPSVLNFRNIFNLAGTITEHIWESLEKTIYEVFWLFPNGIGSEQLFQVDARDFVR